jgi:hypothetical protein
MHFILEEINQQMRYHTAQLLSMYFQLNGTVLHCLGAGVAQSV